MEKYLQKSDEQIAQLAKVDDDFFGVLIDRYENKLSVYIKRLSGLSDDDASDVLQEIFIAAYRNINSFDSSLNFSSWIYRIAHNKTISYWRKHKKSLANVSVEDNLAFVESVFSSEHVFEEAVLRENKEKVLEALESVPIGYKEILILRFMEGRSYEEISDILKAPTSTVGTKIRRAKTSLKKELAKLNFNKQ
jgi:RNA polymerase sigma-70 factor (ECF subfamily)